MFIWISFGYDDDSIYFNYYKESSMVFCKFDKIGLVYSAGYKEVGFYCVFFYYLEESESLYIGLKFIIFIESI